MLKQSICALVLVGCVASAASAIDLVWEPTDLQVNTPTTVSIYLQANDDPYAWGGGAFGITAADGTPSNAANPSGLLSFDTDGPDGLEDTADDGWNWQNGAGTFPPFISSKNPPESSYQGFPDSAPEPFRLDPNEQLLIATLEITGTGLGSADLVLDPQWFNDNFEDVDLKDGTRVTFNIVPEPATMVLLAVGGLCSLRRRRS